jgi:hypothetical protein
MPPTIAPTSRLLEVVLSPKRRDVEFWMPMSSSPPLAKVE